MNPSLYIHIPFCRKRCLYCDFYSCGIESAGLLDIFPRFSEKLLLQKTVLSQEFGIKDFSSLYIGGGTPSLIPASELKRISPLIALAKGEKTIEVNPESVTADLLQAYNDLGINRISMGIQSFQDSILTKMGRLANLSTNMKALELIEKYWSHDWSIDMIFAYPGQTKTTQLKDISSLLAINPPHFSLYTLTVEKGTGLDKSLKQKQSHLPDQEEMEDSWFDSLSLIKESGYERYEISSFGLNHHYSQHNVNYWNMGPWLGLGPGAGSHMHENQKQFCRFTGKSLADFLDCSAAKFKSKGSFYGVEKIGKIDSLKETLMMGLRLSRGIPLETLNRECDGIFLKIIDKVLLKWKDHLIIEEGYIHLNESGMDWHSAVMVDIFFELENHYGCHE